MDDGSDRAAESKVAESRESVGSLGPRIKISENGPYLVSGGPRITRVARVFDEDHEPIDWAWGQDYEAPPKCGLCRCGNSANQPFCDGAHLKTGFDDTLTADRAPGRTRREVFEGTGIVMTDDKSLCASYSFCNVYGGVWKEMGDTADPAVRARVQRQILLCPAGRLECSTSRDGEPIEELREQMIAVIPNGALWVIGGIPIEAPDGFVYETHNRVCLCRCGASKNKPFCDASHRESGFEAP